MATYSHYRSDQEWMAIITTCRQHAGMFARAVIIDKARLFVRRDPLIPQLIA